MTAAIVHRKDLDGLRALAILPVVSHHGGLPGFSGGYVGVDVFFVLSGYLITGIVAAGVAEGSFSFVGFYLRRAKRILPALFAVLGSGFVLGLFLLTPGELQSYGRCLVATVFFVSNIVFWSEGGYFDSAADFKPLLHTWSLGVEEQFYLLWPPLLLLLLRCGKSLRFSLLWGVLVVSFVAACLGVVFRPRPAFFLLPARAWELLLGAALALRMVRAPRSGLAADACSVAGLALIAGSVLALERGSPFPGWNALWPCVGAGLLILAGEGAVVNRRLLSAAPMVWVGLISYSLYLWHWLLLSFANILTVGELAPASALILVGAAAGLSLLTWRYVEVPLRTAVVRAPGISVMRYGAASLAVALVGGMAWSLGGLQQRVSPAVAREEAFAAPNPYMYACDRSSLRVSHVDARCRFDPRVAPDVVVWGDSHADHFFVGVAERLRRAGKNAELLYVSQCPPLRPGSTLVRAKASLCHEFNRRTLNYLRAASNVEMVILAASWDDYGRAAGDAAGQGSAGAHLEADLGEVVRVLEEAGKRVVLLGRAPGAGFDVPRYFARAAMPVSFAPSRPPFARRAAIVESMDPWKERLGQIARSARNARVFFPDEILCQRDPCRVRDDQGALLYRDRDHLSPAGSRFIAGH
ncbi:MAG: acyltransferase, partial [Betaproteobacteria bacterium]|nr:acyltransferase [Betaproteobacteria bacterium]